MVRVLRLRVWNNVAPRCADAAHSRDTDLSIRNVLREFLDRHRRRTADRDTLQSTQIINSHAGPGFKLFRQVQAPANDEGILRQLLPWRHQIIFILVEQGRRRERRRPRRR